MCYTIYMSIAFGVELRVDRVPAVAVPPLEPIIKGTVVSEAILVREVSAESATYFDFHNNKPVPQQTFQVYSLHGEQKNEGIQTGTSLNLYG